MSDCGRGACPEDGANGSIRMCPVFLEGPFGVLALGTISFKFSRACAHSFLAVPVPHQNETSRGTSLLKSGIGFTQARRVPPKLSPPVAETCAARDVKDQRRKGPGRVFEKLIGNPIYTESSADSERACSFPDQIASERSLPMGPMRQPDPYRKLAIRRHSSADSVLKRERGFGVEGGFD